MTDRRRIDVHHHVFPPDYLAALGRHGITDGGGRPIPAWSAEGSVAVMDANEIATAMVSLASPGAHLGDDAEAAELARSANEFCAALAAAHPDRFGWFAALPLPDVDGAVAEAVHALDHLGADGVGVMANSRGTYLGDPRFDPLMEALDRRAAVVFVHPHDLPGPAADGIPPFVADFLLDTTRAAYNLVVHDVPIRFPNVRVILCHAGGMVPYAAYRLAMSAAEAAGRQPAEMLAGLASLYIEVAISANPLTLPSLLAFSAPGHLLYGSDWPFAPAQLIDRLAGELERYPGLDGEAGRAIDRANAEALFPRLAA